MGAVNHIQWSTGVDAVDLDTGTVQVRGTVIRLKGQGLVLTSTTKSTAGMRILALPTWCVEVLRARARRQAEISLAAGEDPVFPSPQRGLRDPSNTHGDLRESLAWCGLPWVTSHVFRALVGVNAVVEGCQCAAVADESAVPDRDACGVLEATTDVDEDAC